MKEILFLQMKILVFSDSHGHCDRMINVTKEFISKNNILNYIIHLGDLVQDAKYLQERFPDIPVLYVYGNCDYSVNRSDDEKEYELGGKKFFILHGHTRNVKFSPDTLKTLAEQKKYDIILYGHTHEPKEDYISNGTEPNGVQTGTYIINPGSITYDKSGRGKSYCVIDITKNDLCANIIRIN